MPGWLRCTHQVTAPVWSLATAAAVRRPFRPAASLPARTVPLCSNAFLRLGAPRRNVDASSPRHLATICKISKAAQLRLDNGPQPLVISSGRAIVIVGIDPDANGAIATAQWEATAPRTQQGMPLRFEDAKIVVVDMPMQPVNIGSRVRRQPDAAEITRLFNDMLPSSLDKTNANVALEQPVPSPLNGKFSWFNSGLAYGMWLGLLAAYDMPFQTPKVRRWKSDLQLDGMGKEGSRLLALQLFPQAAGQLRRKKDHGRAEALLIAAWASQIPIPQTIFQAAFSTLALSASAKPLPEAEEEDLVVC